MLLFTLSFILNLLTIWLGQSFFFFNFFFSFSLAGIIAFFTYPIVLGITYLVMARAHHLAHNIKQKFISYIGDKFVLFIYYTMALYAFGVWISYCATHYLKLEQWIEHNWLYFIVSLFFATWPIRQLREQLLSDINKTRYMNAYQYVETIRYRILYPNDNPGPINPFEYINNENIKNMERQIYFSPLLSIAFALLFTLLVIFPSWNTLFLGNLMIHLFSEDNFTAFIGGMLFFIVLLKWIISPVIIFIIHFIKKKHL